MTDTTELLFMVFSSIIDVVPSEEFAEKHFLPDQSYASYYVVAKTFVSQVYVPSGTVSATVIVTAIVAVFPPAITVPFVTAVNVKPSGIVELRIDIVIGVAVNRFVIENVTVVAPLFNVPHDIGEPSLYGVVPIAYVNSSPSGTLPVFVFVAC